MNQQTINVVLTASADVDVLAFELDANHPEAYAVNLNSSTSQNELKNVFSKLLQMLLDEDLVLNFLVAEGYGKGLYKDVCREYIDDLNRELAQVREMIKQEIA